MLGSQAKLQELIAKVVVKTAFDAIFTYGKLLQQQFFVC